MPSNEPTNRGQKLLVSMTTRPETRLLKCKLDWVLFLFLFRDRATERHTHTHTLNNENNSVHLFIEPSSWRRGCFIHYSKLHIIIDGFSIIIFLQNIRMFALLILFFVILKRKKKIEVFRRFSFFAFFWLSRRLVFVFWTLHTFLGSCCAFSDHTLCNATERWTLSMTFDIFPISDGDLKTKKRKRTNEHAK